MAKVTVTSAGTQILNGAQSTNTVVVVGSTPVRFGTGTIGARVFDDLAPLGAGQYIVFPPSIIVTVYALPTKTQAFIYTEGFGA
jgi:hypothetical protein